MNLEADVDFFYNPQNILSYNIDNENPIWKKCHISFMIGGV